MENTMNKIKKVISFSAFVILALTLSMVTVQAENTRDQKVDKHLTNLGDNPCPESGKDCMPIVVTPDSPQ